MPTIEAALELGITEISEIRQLIVVTDAEEFRAKVLGILNSMSESNRRGREIVGRLATVITADVGVAERHARAQSALLHRIEVLAEDATTEDNEHLTEAYMQLPRPYEDSFTPPRP